MQIIFNEIVWVMGYTLKNWVEIGKKETSNILEIIRYKLEILKTWNANNLITTRDGKRKFCKKMNKMKIF